MNQINNIVLEGTLINDPEVVAKANTSDSRLVKFTVANDSYYKDATGLLQQKTTFMVIQCWGELGEKVMKSLKKGTIARIVGKLEPCRWVTRTGEKRWSNEILANHIEYRPKEPALVSLDSEEYED